MLRAPTGHNASPPCQRRQLRVGQIAAMNHHVNPSAAIIECNKTACPSGSLAETLPVKIAGLSKNLQIILPEKKSKSKTTQHELS